MRDNYTTLKGTGTNELSVSKSRFIAYCTRAESEEDALLFIQKIKKDHANATHNCSAYLIGAQNQIQKASDDGEPSGTAGIPILEVLKKQKLQDVVVVITRYFGGIKLGAGGLVRAYGKATTLGIASTGLVERRLHERMSIIIDYTLLGKLENEIRNSSYILHQINYNEAVEFIVDVEKTLFEDFEEWITNLTNGQVKFTSVQSHFIDFDVL